LTFRLQHGENIPALVQRMAAALEGVTIVDLLVFGSNHALRSLDEAFKKVFPMPDWPVTWVDGEGCNKRHIAGIQVTGFIGGTVGRIRSGGKVVGSVFTYGGARHCVVGGIRPDGFSDARGDQTKQALEKLAATLGQAGFSIADIVRTWFFLEDILSWYPEFNRARTAIYSGIRFRTGSPPASTGVGIRRPHRGALALKARAMRPLNGSAAVVEVASPLQCPAPAYGSSFSRAMEISTTAGRQLFISGTASIAPAGETLWKDDIIEQVALTMKIVEALLRSRGYRLEDVTRAVAYFKHRAVLPVFEDWYGSRRAASLPVVAAHCDICRDDLGFEFEADAEKPA